MFAIATQTKLNLAARAKPINLNKQRFMAVKAMNNNNYQSWDWDSDDDSTISTIRSAFLMKSADDPDLNMSNVSSPLSWAKDWIAPPGMTRNNNYGSWDMDDSKNKKPDSKEERMNMDM